MRVLDRLAARAPIEIRMHHLPDDRSRPDDRDLHDEVVEMSRLHPRQRRHLRARFDLEEADRVGVLQHAVDGGIVRREMGEIDAAPAAGLQAPRLRRGSGRACPSSGARSPAVRLAIDQRDRVLQHRHHAEAEQIDLDDAHVGAVVLVPLHDDAAGHAGVLERHDRVEAALADRPCRRECWPRWRGRSCMRCQRSANCRSAGARPSTPPSRRWRASVSARSMNSKRFISLASRSICAASSAERLPHLARRAAAAIGDHVGRHRRAQLAVALVDVLDHLLAPVAARQVEIDVGPLAALFREKPLEQQVHARPDRRR